MANEGLQIKKSVKGLKIKKWVFFGCYCLFSLIMPCVIVGVQYGAFSTVTTTKVKIAGGGLVVLLLAFFFIKKNWNRFVEWLAPGVFKRVICYIKYVTPFALLAVLGGIAHMSADNFWTTTIYIAVPGAIGSLFEVYYDTYAQQLREIKLTKRQKKYSEEYDI